MNNFKKIGLTSLAGSLVATSVFAGAMTVTGGASFEVQHVNGGAVNTKYDGDSDIVWVNNTSTLATHQVEMIPPKRMNQKMIVFHNYTGGSSELNSGVRVNFGVTARCVEGIFHYHSSSGGTVAGSNITNTLTSAMTANNKYIILLKNRYITFIGMKNPLTDELFWIVEDSVGKKLN